MKSVILRTKTKPKPTNSGEILKWMEVKNEGVIVLALEEIDTEWNGDENDIEIRGIVWHCSHFNEKYSEGERRMFKKDDLIEFDGVVTSRNW